MTKFIYRQKLKLEKESPTNTHKMRFKRDIERKQGSLSFKQENEPKTQNRAK
jgi:hypothetical protein